MLSSIRYDYFCWLFANNVDVLHVFIIFAYNITESSMFFCARVCWCIYHHLSPHALHSRARRTSCDALTGLLYTGTYNETTQMPFRVNCLFCYFCAFKFCVRFVLCLFAIAVAAAVLITSMRLQSVRLCRISSVITVDIETHSRWNHLLAFDAFYFCFCRNLNFVCACICAYATFYLSF